MTDQRNKDTTPPAVVPAHLDQQHPAPRFTASILAPPGFPIPQATSNNHQYQTWVNYSTACALQQFYWSQLLASFVTPSNLPVLVPNEGNAPNANLKMEQLEQSVKVESHDHQRAPNAPASAPLNRAVAVKSEVAMETKISSDSDSSLVTMTTTPGPVAVHSEDKDNPKLLTKKSKDYVCDQCDRRFGFKHVLKNHLRRHTGEKPYKCSVCQRKFGRAHHLQTHMRMHTGEKPYECTDCNEKFVQYGNLQRHFLKKHTEAGGSQDTACKMCAKTFADVMKLRLHVKKCHKPEVAPSSA